MFLIFCEKNIQTGNKTLKIPLLRNMFFCIFLCFFSFSCTPDFIPKPKGYNRLDLPPHNYKLISEDHPYSFEHSIYSKILKDTSSFSEPHWIDIWYPNFRCNIQITYKELGSENKKFDELVDDSHKLTSKHQVKAYSIDEGVIKTKGGYVATVFELSGEVPSQFQFYVTDSSKHFIRGALYFRTSTRNDSLAPVIEYMKEDIMHLLNTLKFEN